MHASQATDMRTPKPATHMSTAATPEAATHMAATAAEVAAATTTTTSVATAAAPTSHGVGRHRSGSQRDSRDQDDCLMQFDSHHGDFLRMVSWF
jgi:hypothetical protein